MERLLLISLGKMFVSILSFAYRRNSPIRPGLMHEGCAGEGQSTRVLNTNMVLLVKYSLIEESTGSYRYEIFIHMYTPRHASPSVYHASPHLCKPFRASKFQLESYSWGVVLFMSTIDSCARSLFARVLNSSVVYVWVWSYWRIFTVFTYGYIWRIFRGI